MRNGEADAVLADKSFLTPIVGRRPGEVLEKTESSGRRRWHGFRESDAELRGKFDAAIQSMKDDGSLNALIAKWEVVLQW